MVTKEGNNDCPRINALCSQKISTVADTMFIIMAYTELHSKKIEQMLAKAVKEIFNLKPILAKNIRTTGSTDVYCTRVCKPIQESEQCIIDMTYKNTNVGIELATAQRFKKPVIITKYTPKLKGRISVKEEKILKKLSKAGLIQYSELPILIATDVTSMYIVEYSNEAELKRKLKQTINIVKSNP